MIATAVGHLVRGGLLAYLGGDVATTNLRDEQGMPFHKTCAEALGGRHQRSAQSGA
ncbi:hypothetical protein [Streptomyces cinereoruber]|uniref:hypothetical protein n=1 Tax=Streptomyces cinereoruber TaxID=67260 RepID=UPI00363B599D